MHMKLDTATSCKIWFARHILQQHKVEYPFLEKSVKVVESLKKSVEKGPLKFSWEWFIYFLPPSCFTFVPLVPSAQLEAGSKAA
jgi:hypothetical protein